MKSLRQSFLLQLLTRGQLSITVEHNFDQQLTFKAKHSFAIQTLGRKSHLQHMWMKSRTPQFKNKQARKLQATLEDANPKLSLTHLLTDGGEV